MNKKNSKNESKQQTRRRESRPVSRDSASTRRQIKSPPVTTLESGINFLVNVSSSGTNLNKQIELELARLDSVEKKIRKHKCRATAVTPSKPPTSNPNKRKLRNILESMLSNMNYTPPKSKKHSTSYQKVRLSENYPDTGKRYTKPKKIPPIVESLTDFSINNHKMVFNSAIPKMDNVFVKSAMKKPTSAPNDNRNNIFADDLKFAENLRFGKNVDLHFTLSDLKKMARSSSNNFRGGYNQEVSPQKCGNKEKFSNLKNFKVIIEQPSKSNISYIYDSTSFDCLKPEGLPPDAPNWQNDPIRTFKKTSSYDFVKKLPTTQRAKLSEVSSRKENEESRRVEEKPESKKFYSYLKRGNFTISGRVDEDNNGSDEAHNTVVETKAINEELHPEVDEDSSNCENKKISMESEEETNEDRVVHTVINEEAAQEHLDDNIIENKQITVDSKKSFPDMCDFPTELLERGILAVETVLHTIDSLANEFNTSTEIRDPFFGEVEALETLEDLLEDTSIDQLMNKLREDVLRDSKNDNVGELQDKPDGDQLPNCKKYISEINKKLPKASEGSFSESKPTILCSGDSVQETNKNSHESTKIKGKSFFEKHSQMDVVYLKAPVKNFLNSEENFSKIATSKFSLMTDKSGIKEKQDNPMKHVYVIPHEEDDVDPLMMALESLRNRVNAIEEEMVDECPKRNNVFMSHGASTTISFTRENLSGKLHCPEHVRRISVKEPLISRTFSDTSCHSLPTSQSDNNFTNNHSYSVSCSSDGSRASSCRKYFMPPKYSSKYLPRQSNRIFNNGGNRGNGSLAGSVKESSRMKLSKIFPDYYIDRCLKLLRKRFQDFDNLRNKTIFSKKSNESMKTKAYNVRKVDVSNRVMCRIENVTKPKREKSMQRQTEMLWINNTKENYKVCFKNENFNNRSETSIESCSKAVSNVVKQKNVHTISRIKSSP